MPAAGYPFERIRVEGLDRRNPLKAARAVLRAVLAVPRAMRILRRARADAVMAGGGYVAGPVGLAAVLLRIPLVVTEADSHLGVANRLLAPFARRVCLAFPLDGRSGARYRVTGRPVPPSPTDASAARARFGLAPDDTVVLVFGGSLGARSINFAAAEAFTGATFRVLHAAGTRDFEALTSPGEHYDLRPYIDDFGDALLAADLVVARSGGSVFEIAAAGRPAILVPYPHAAADHQTTNARWMEEGGAAIVIPDAELDAARLGHAVAELLHDRSHLGQMAHASAALARPDAAREIAGELLGAVRR